ncbi:TATA box-binding protein-like protein 1 [Nasonia vitripennis]|uniref:TATA box-binding protein-like 1 n=1 Tax=Nasonia vitripennis TaxID=7425 RepID=A0A7M7Q351_NASVI|nr:TATA box-binding protein-like protein 1 [Nasonia vitripennis]XP_031781138.1 TATA box-binding protein-like protein 1 [Nasonia vitripennis]XP_031781139.1 TATA box-binding protein-like protein 1 [Nasonia vitripennis]
MATFVNKNGIKPITNGTLSHVQNSENFEDNHLSFTGKSKDILDVHVESCLDNAEEKPELDIIISNVVCSFSVRCHLNLREIALNGSNVEYRRENGLVRMRLRKPCTLASISSSGKVTCTGATSEEEAKKAARRCARSLQKLGFRVRFNNYRIVNVLGTCTMPWAIKITSFSTHYKDIVQYEPEIQPGVIYKLKNMKATLRIFSTGSITVTAPSINAVQAAIEHIYPLVYEFRKERSVEEQFALENKKRRLVFTIKESVIGEDEDNDNFSAEDDNSENSNTSWT